MVVRTPLKCPEHTKEKKNCWKFYPIHRRKRGMKSQIKKTTKNFHWKLTKSIYNKLKLFSHTFISPTHWKPSNQHTRKRKKLITQAIYTPRKVLHPTRDSLMKNLWFLKQRENGWKLNWKSQHKNCENYQKSYAYHLIVFVKKNRN